jgi:hypothetical protein
LDAEYVPNEAQFLPRANDHLKIGDLDLIWREHHCEEYFIDFKTLGGAPSSHGVAYAVCYLVTDEDLHDLEIRIGSDDHVKIYLNGEQIHRNPAIRSIGDNQDRVRNLNLKKGTNVLVFKVVNLEGEWSGCLRFAHADGHAAKGIRVQLTP